MDRSERPWPGLMSWGGQPNQVTSGHDQQGHVEERNEAPASGDEAAEEAGGRDRRDECRADELRDRGPDVAGAEDAEGEALAVAAATRR
jgi:hypothetical protein